jgi:ABC-type uncharacterized transport system YnjBCD permease subunit
MATQQQPEVKAVAVKSQGQQVILAMHRILQGLMKMHTATINALRGQWNEMARLDMRMANIERSLQAW